MGIKKFVDIKQRLEKMRNSEPIFSKFKIDMMACSKSKNKNKSIKQNSER